MEYHLYPPFLIVPEESSFPDAWEAFCCKILNLVHKQGEIYRRTPPESGIDLYCPTTKTAYQCKSVESGQAGAFSSTKALDSLRAALKAKESLDWTNYVLCTNVDITGTAEAALKREYPSIQLHPRSYWTSACERFPDAVQRNFRRLVSVPTERQQEALRNEFPRHYSEELRKLLATEAITLFLYADQHEKMYQVPVSLDFRVLDLIRVLTRVFKLPNEVNHLGDNLLVILSYSLAFEGKKLALDKTLRECGLTDRGLVTYWVDIEIENSRGALHARVLHREISDGSAYLTEDLHKIASRCEEVIRSAFLAFDRTVVGDCK